MNLKNSKDKVKVLKGTGMFSDTEADVLTRLAEKMLPLHLNEDETIFYKGDTGHAMYVIAKGEVKVHDRNHVFDTLSAGDVFGEYSLIDTEVRSATITGVEATDLLIMEKEAFYELISVDQKALQGILKIMVARLRKLDIIQSELSQKKKEIEIQKEEIEIKNEELVALNEEKNHLISIVAHDIRNPLSSASTFANLLLSDMDTLTEEHGEYATHLVRSLDRMTDLVTRILDVKAIESKHIQIHPRKFNIKAEIDDIMTQVADKAQGKKITIVQKLADVQAVLDQGLFRQITENLITNAIKFSPKDKKIWVTLSVDDDLLKFEVRDEGPGFTLDDQRKLFGKFQQLSARPTGGESSTGLGLSIVKKFTDSMKGKVWCESESGKGATFYVELPVYLE